MSVYFIQEGGNGYIKIGQGDGYKRMKSMQTGNPWRLDVVRQIDGSFQDEYVLHQIFYKDRINPRSEWFVGSEELMDFINDDEIKIYSVISFAKDMMDNNYGVSFIFCKDDSVETIGECEGVYAVIDKKHPSNFVGTTIVMDKILVDHLKMLAEERNKLSRENIGVSYKTLV